MEITMPPARRKLQGTLLTAWLILPLAALAALCWGIAIMMQHPPKPIGPPVGAGAGYTGGANAIGNLLAGKPANDHAMPPERRPGEEHAAAAAAPVEADMVQPESLPQGFIIVVEDKAKRANQTSPIFMPSNLYNNWNPGDKQYQLTAQSDMKWRIELPQPAQWKGVKDGARLEFKFTRGTWELEELKDDLTPPANRTLEKIDASKLKPGEKPVIELSVAKWGDQKSEYSAKRTSDPYAALEVTGTVKRLQIVGGAGGAEGAVRECLVWLPAGYDDAANAEKKYPVLYMHDGQNLFTKHSGAPAEWSLDETATKLIADKKLPPMVIVGIPNSGAARMSEYLPADAIPKMARPAGDDYVEFLVGFVKPRVERAFRVETVRSKVGVGGSSLGAAIALHAAFLHPDQFGLVLAESLPLKTGSAEGWQKWLTPHLMKKGILPEKVFIGIGGKEAGDKPENKKINAGYVDACRDLTRQLTEFSGGKCQAVLVLDDDATHTESAWAGRASDALQMLFGAGLPGLEHAK